MKFKIVFLIYYQVFKQTLGIYYWVNENEMQSYALSRIQTNHNIYVGNYRSPRDYIIQNPVLYPVSSYNMETSLYACPSHFFYRFVPQIELPHNYNMHAYPVLYENQQEITPNMAPIVDQSLNIDYRFVPTQYNHLHSPANPELQESNNSQTPINNPCPFVTNQYTGNNNAINIRNQCLNNTIQQNPLLYHSIKKKFRNLWYRPADPDILSKLQHIWATYIEKTLNNTDFQILNYFRKLDMIENWKKLDDNCEMFQKDIRCDIEFHIPAIFQDVTIFRQKSFNENEKYIYDYLFVKGDPKKDLKNLSWRGNKIFIMDSSGIGNDVKLNKYTYIGKNCKIGDKTYISNNCFLKKNVEIESETFIGSKNFLGEYCKIGKINISENLPCDENVEFIQYEMECIGFLEKQKFKTVISSLNYFPNNFIVPFGYFIGCKKLFLSDYHSMNR